MRSVSLPSSVRNAVASAVLGSALLVAPQCRAAPESAFIRAALAEGLFQQFVGLVRKAGLEDKLGSGPQTVFMPTDGAFKRLPAKQRAALLGLSPDLTRQFVEHFIVPNVALSSTDLPKSVTTLDGTSFQFAWRPGDLSLQAASAGTNGRIATFVDGDVHAGQGIIQAIDTVVLAPAVKAEVERVAASAQTATPDTGSAAAKQSDPGSPGAKQSDAGATAAAPPAPPASAPAPEPSASRPADAAASGPVPSISAPAPAPPAPPATAPVAAAPVAPAPGGHEGPAVAVANIVAPTPVKPETPAGSASSAPSTVTASTAPGPAAVPAPAAAPEVSVTARDLAGWRVRSSDGQLTGSVDRLVLGLPAGRVLGISARFNAILGLGGKRMFIPWNKVTADPQGHVLNLGLTAAEVNSATK